jgi:hypothetical protein
MFFNSVLRNETAPRSTWLHAYYEGELRVSANAIGKEEHKCEYSSWRPLLAALTSIQVDDKFSLEKAVRMGMHEITHAFANPVLLV